MVDFFILDRGTGKTEGGGAMQRRYIKAVKPLANYVLQVDYVSGSRMLLDLSRRLNTMRLRPLKQPEVWNSAGTNGIFVRFGRVELSHDEILELAERPTDEGGSDDE